MRFARALKYLILPLKRPRPKNVSSDSDPFSGKRSVKSATSSIGRHGNEKNTWSRMYSPLLWLLQVVPGALQWWMLRGRFRLANREGTD
ncbi:hypothetical protein TNCT_269621 [Trichonephila clavata]|uniref:Uncharacterized protein n=1 Tax=Trichonephila clavata TaxID=2740835 RepID=A0A8X6GIT5_TRICU|nr:hypothetical protein TNCT_269621 [Trichonephila clavata]